MAVLCDVKTAKISLIEFGIWDM